MLSRDQMDIEAPLESHQQLDSGEAIESQVALEAALKSDPGALGDRVVQLAIKVCYHLNHPIGRGERGRFRVRFSGERLHGRNSSCTEGKHTSAAESVGVFHGWAPHTSVFVGRALQAASNARSNINSSSALMGLLATRKRVSRANSRTAVEVSPVMSTAFSESPKIFRSAAIT